MSVSKRQIKALEQKASLIKNLQASFAELEDSELKKMFFELRQDFEDKKISEADLETYVYAIVCEISRRVLGQDPYVVQVMGALCLNGGDVASMATGEGKTLTATMPAVLNVITQKNVHIVTANEYLARRDAEKMGRVYDFLGLKTGIVYSGQNLEEKKQAYDCDIVYGTCSEFGFDYLRDNLAPTKERKTGQKLGFALVDEVDQILIDEATIPMILSESMNINLNLFIVADEFVRTLGEADYEFDKKGRNVYLAESGYQKLEKMMQGVAAVDINEMQYYVDVALKAHHLLAKDRDYIVENGEIILIDKNTGRTLEGRQYSKFLHQALQAKEKIQIKQPSKTNATISVQMFFSKYEKIAGMTGTAKSAEDEFLNTYHMQVYEIPTNKPLARVDEPVQVYVDRKTQLEAILKEAQQTIETGRPILIGAKSIEESQEIARFLNKNGVPCTLLNASTKEEAEIISCAGMRGMITIATNVAGRGTDIKLGGDPEMLTIIALKQMGIELSLAEQNIVFAKEFDSNDELLVMAREMFLKFEEDSKAEKVEVNNLGGLRVVATSLGDSQRVTKQLIGRSGRQGDNGSSVVLVSLEDEVLERYGYSGLEEKADESGLIHDDKLDALVKKAEDSIDAENRGLRDLNLKIESILHGIREKTYESRNKILEMENFDDAIEYYIYQVIFAKLEEKPTLEEFREFLSKYFGGFAPVVNGMPEMPSDEFADAMAETIAKFRKRAIQKVERKSTKPEAVSKLKENEKAVMLSNLDIYWTDFLNNVEDVQNASFLQVYAQRDPFAELQYGLIQEYQKAVLAAQQDTVKFIFTQLDQLAKQLEIDPKQMF